RGVLRGSLWIASWIVPGGSRSEWSQEWRTELWYALRGCFSATGPDLRSIGKATAFCTGAWQDALWLRRRSWQSQPLVSRIRNSPLMCVALLIGIVVLAWGIARCSNTVSAGMSAVEVYPWRATNQRHSPCDCAVDLSIGARSLTTARAFFDGFSHYTITRESVSGEKVRRANWAMAHARPDFFRVLKLPVRLMTTGSMNPANQPQIVLSRDTWLRNFGGRGDLAGTRLHVGSVDGVVVGIAFGSSMGLPGKVN